ncbi:DUF4437 domain-containing protein [Pseudoalteromonas sp. DL2-H2.2]|uniref:DUF4437 domain-containing protein n=1 Tax=Pseudoalteromonas sp. DL2-H2.2 TaxID=2908889 RepID=UPI001F462772|nr:DUF4437 domain-containing protein [Pseudoalteromonas sp. DL2-H2.2]MCF2907029.1 DUF4437 domain-containing protein [Pseudoalteromonas sp. DL2-H2.2]
MAKSSLLSAFIISACFFSHALKAQDTSLGSNEVTIISTEQIEWGHLNPARGDKSPKAANLWGDRTQAGATGMLVRFEPGFSSPPHIHNVSYRGIVIEGLLHNDDPQAKAMWMPPGSYWTQPAGEDHITSANAPGNMIYLEIDQGPYLVKPSAQQFDNGERPVNLHYANLTWLDQHTSTQLKGAGIQLANLWQQGPLTGVLVKLPANAKVQLSSTGSEFKAVVIRGALNFLQTKTQQNQVLRPGSYLAAGEPVQMALSADESALLYVRTNEPFQIARN